MTETPSFKQRKEREQWLATLERYKQLKISGWDGTTPRGHELEKWVQRQRTLHNHSKLMPWKQDLLNAASFDFISPRVTKSSTDQDHAHALVAFYAKHGHLAPTQTFGGPGLTKWWGKFRTSRGTVGLVSGSKDSARAALEILRNGLPEGFFDYPSKSQLNLSQELTHNGYVPSRLKTTDRDLLVHFALSSRSLTLMNKTKRQVRSNEGFRAIIQLLGRAAMFHQALRVAIEGDETPYWLSNMAFNGSMDPLLVRCELATGPKVDGSSTSHHIRFREAQLGYFEHGTLCGAEFKDEFDRRVRITYDALLGDQTSSLYYNDIDRDAGWRVYRLTSNAHVMKSMAASRSYRRLTDKTTANRHFQKNLNDLRVWVDLQGVVPVPHIVWSMSNYRFKFIEHMFRKLDRSELSFSHAEQLQQVHATWGLYKTLLRDLFAPIIFPPFLRGPERHATKVRSRM